MKKRKNENWLTLVIGLSLIVLFLFGIMRTGTALAASSNSTKTFSISSNSDFTKKADISNLIAKVGDVISIYFYATNGGFTQCPEVPQAIPLTVTLTDPNNISKVYNIIIPKGPANTYGVLPNINCALRGKWTVKVYGDPGKGNVSATNTFTVTGNQAALNVIPPDATISLGSAQKFEALFTDSLGTSTPISDDPVVFTIPEALNYALFSGSSTSTLALNGTNITINGNTHSNKDFIASVSKLDISGTCEAVTTVQLNGNPNDIHIGKIAQNAPSIVMPDIGSAIIAMAQATGQTYNGNKSYNDTNVSLNSPIYVNGDLEINCNQFSGKGPIVATGNITINSTTLSVTNDAPVCLYSKNGNITIGNSSVNIKGMVYAPDGTITMNGTYLTISGRVIGKVVEIHPNQLTIDSSSNDLTSLIASGVPQVTWSSSNTSVATISSTGLATSTGLGTCVITAVYTINNVTYTDTSQLTIVPPTLILDPESTTIPLGSPQQYQVTLEDSDGNLTDVTKSVTWSSSSSGVATIESSGLATSKGVGTSIITATYRVSGVSIPTTATLMVVNLSIAPANKIISLGLTQQYQAEFTDSDGKVTDVTPSINQWSSISFSSVVSTINANGLATSKGLGPCTITATYVVNGVSITASTPLTIIKPTLSITPVNTTISIRSIQMYLATLIDSEGKHTDVTTVDWSIDNLSVATIDASGLVTGSGVGACTITGSYTINGVSITGTTPLAVVLPTLSIVPPTTTISSGSTQQYQAILRDYAGHTTDVTQSVIWSSKGVGLASAIINQQGVATAHGSGTCTITATDPISKAFGTATLIITMPSISITPISKNILPGSTQQYQAILTDSAGRMTDVTQSANWISNNISVATINGLGLATGNIAGTCTITGTDPMSGVSDTVTLTVMAPAQLKVTLINTVPLAIGGNVQVTAVLVYPDNSTKDITNSVTWTSSNSNVATVDSNGKATGLGGGLCIITATDSSSGLSGSANLNVLPALTLSPSLLTIPIGYKLQYNAQLVYVDGTTSQVVNDRVTWTSSNTGVAEIDTKGLASGKAEGSSTITAQDAITGSYQSAKLMVAANNDPVAALIVTPVPITNAVFVGYTQQFSARLKYSDGSTSDVTNLVAWTSGTTPVATIGDTGLVTGVSSGTSIISATLNINNNPLKGSYLLTVLPLKGGIIREWEK